MNLSYLHRHLAQTKIIIQGCSDLIIHEACLFNITIELSVCVLLVVDGVSVKHFVCKACMV